MRDATRLIARNTASWVLMVMILGSFGCRSAGKDERTMTQEELKEILEYYTKQGIVTDPGEHAELYEDLPSELPELVRTVQGFVIHVFHAHRHGIELSDERQKEVGIRSVRDMLTRVLELDDRPLTVAREPEKRLVGNCRDYSVFLASMLKSKGIPARARCGFGSYFVPGRHEDHWICEYWSDEGARWVRADGQLDSLQIEAFGLDFDPLDLPEGAFLAGGEAWKRCQAGELDPETFGIFDMKGLWFIRDNVLRDFMALNRVELMPWDPNPFMKTLGQTVTEDQVTVFDSLAELTTGGNARFEDLRALYESDERVRMPEDWTP
jgi:hypothetical protein